ACGDGTAGIIAQTVFPFLDPEAQRDSTNWEPIFVNDYAKIQESIAIEFMDQILINHTYNSVRELLKEGKILKYHNFSGEFNDLDIIMFDNVKEKMQSLKGVFKEDEIKYIKETKSYENYMNGGFFTYIDT